MEKKDITSLKFHIKSNDYFSTLATILFLIRQNLERNEHKRLNTKILNKIEKDLLFLQKNYKINKKNINNKTKQFYTAQELADLLSFNVMTIYRYIKSGKLRAYKIGKEFKIEKIEFNKLLNKNKYDKQNKP
ncbi:MAG: helix-turn-helix domain-containing protein [Patescibacteria group bacterium]|jgi:excisionase family DNA binding protein